jgi:hypothetical protein
VRSSAWIWLCSSTQSTKGFVERIQIKPNHVVEFLYEALVAAELEGFDQVRFQVVLKERPGRLRVPVEVALKTVRN